MLFTCASATRISARALSGALALALVLAAGAADAKRLGGGSSSGRQSSNVSRSATPQQAAPASPSATPKQAPAAAPARAPAQQPSRWGSIGSMLGGLAAGMGLGYLFSHFGGDLFGGAGMGSFLMLLAALAIGGWLFHRMAASQTSAYAGGPQAQAGQPLLQSIPARHQPYEMQSYTPAVAAAPAALQCMENWDIPQGFDTETFLRNAKSNFVRLQGDWDAGNLDDLRDLTTPEMFTEIRTQVSNRVGRDKTEVVTLDAGLLGIEQTSEEYLASVLFGGMIRENQGGPAESFSEVWNLVRPADGKTGWLLAGIQQIQ